MIAQQRIPKVVADDTGRIAMYEECTEGSDGSDAVLTRYIYSNHLGSASLELDGSGEIISYEEYHPYGTTAYQAESTVIDAVAKRYRYTGKERDEETGLYYHGARYYIPWLCRWSSVDPKQGEMPVWSPYNYGFCNPIVWNDPDGMHPKTGADQQNLAQQEASEDDSAPADVEVQNPTGSGSPTNPVELEKVVVTAKRSNKIFDFNGDLDGGRWLDIRGAKHQFEHSEGGFSDPLNYASFVSNAGLSFWNQAIDVADVVINNVGLADEAGAYISNTYNYFANTPASQQWSDFKADAVNMATDIRTFENLAAMLLLRKVSPATSKPVSAPATEVGGAVRTGTGLIDDAAGVLSEGDYLRIQNAATRINKPITVVGSRASGTAKAYSDWDYVIPGLNSRNWSTIKNSLPGSRSILDNAPRNIDIFKGPLDVRKPHIIIKPRP